MSKLLPLLLLLTSTTSVANSTAGTEPVREWRFRALLDERDIGHHTFRLSGDGERRVLDSEASFEVRFLFLTAYAYDHRATETWAGNCLQAVSAETNDNDVRYAVSGARRAQGFVLNADGGNRQLPPCVMSFAYWNPAILNQQRLLNLQTGAYVPVEVRSDGAETLRLGGRSVPAERYTLRAEGREIRLWYDRERHTWLGLESDTEQGYTLRYELKPEPADND